MENQYINVESDIDAIVRLKKEILEFQQVIEQTDKKADPKGFRELEIQLNANQKQFQLLIQSATLSSDQLLELLADVLKLAETVGVGTDKMAELRGTIEKTSNASRVLGDSIGGIDMGEDKVGTLIGGMTSVLKLFSTTAGAARLFGADLEAVQKVQERLRTGISILQGIKQGFDTAKSATGAWKMAQNMLTTALGISTVAAKALVGTLTLGVGVAIGVVTSLIAKWQQKQEELKQQQREAAEQQEKQNKGIAESAAGTIVEYKRLQGMWQSLNGDLKAQTKFIKENSESFRNLGISVKNVGEAENLFAQGEKDFVKSVINRAKAVAVMEVAAQKYKTAIEKQLALDARINSIYATPETIHEYEEAEKEARKRMAFIWFPNRDDELRRRELVKQIIQEGRDAEQRAIDKEYNAGDNIIRQILSPLDLTVKKPNKGSSAEYQNDLDKETEFQNRILQLITNGQSELEKSRLAIMCDGRNKELTEIDLRHKQVLAKIESDRKELETAYKRAGKDSLTSEDQAVFDERVRAANQERNNSRTGVNKKYAEELEGIYRQLSDVFLTEEERKRNGIEKTYDDLIRWAEKALEAGNIDFSQYFAVTFRIDEARQRALIQDTVDQFKSLDQFKTFEQRKLEITQEYNAKIAALRSAGYKDEADRAEKEKSQKLAEINLKEVTQPLDSVFGEIDTLTNDALNSLIQRITDFIADSGEDLDTTALRSLTETLTRLRAESTSRNPFTSLANSIRKYNQATSELKNAQQENLSGEKIEHFRAAQQKALKDVGLSTKACSSNIKLIGSSFTELGSVLKEVDGSAGEIVSTIGETVSTIDMMGDAVDNVSKLTAEGISTVEKASVILAIIQAAFKVFNLIKGFFEGDKEEEQKREKALAELADSKVKLQREYNQLLFEQNLLLKEAQSIFGSSEITKAANDYSLYRQELEKLDELMKGESPGNAPRKTGFSFFDNKNLEAYQKKLEDYQKGTGGLNSIQAVSGGHWEWNWLGTKAKWKDDYKGLLDLYPRLIGENGKLDVAYAKSLASSAKFAGKGKEDLEAIIAAAENAEKAFEQLDSYLQDTFGELGSSIMDSLTEAIQDKGVNAWEAFGKAGASVLENLGKQIAYEIFFADKFVTLQEQLQAVYGSGKSSEQIANDAQQKIADFYQGIGVEMQRAQVWMEEWQRQAKEKGFDLWAGDDAAQQQSSSRAGFQAMSQETGNELNGRFTSMDMKMHDIRNTLGESLAVSYETRTLVSEHVGIASELRDLQLRAVFHLKNIETNTGDTVGRIDQSNTYLRQIAEKL